jgi:hypothetical protein
MGLVNNQKAYDQYLIWQDGCKNMTVNGQVIGYTFQIRMPNFRGNYLSCVEQLAFTLDGEEVPVESMEVLLNNKRFRIADFPKLFMEYWDVNDCAVIEVMKEGGLRGTHKIGAAMKLRYGYSAYFGVCKVVTSRCEKTFDFTGKECA